MSRRVWSVMRVRLARIALTSFAALGGLMAAAGPAHAWSASLSITVRAADDTSQEFPVEVTGTGSDGSSFDDRFTLRDRDSRTLTLHKGDYRISEELPPRWRLVRVDCESDSGDADVSTDLDQGRAWLRLDRDEDVRCTLYNEKETRSAHRPADSEAIAPPPPPPVAAPAPPPPPAVAAAPPTAKLTAPRRCVSRRYVVTVAGASMWHVALRVNGKRAGTMMSRSGRRRFSVRLPVTARIMRISARVDFMSTTATRGKALRAVVRRCPPAASRPAFTG